jgi:PAS domain S-box-containing protein
MKRLWPQDLLTRRGLALWSALIVLVAASLGAAEPQPRRVLLLYSYERDFAPHREFAAQFRPELSRTSREPVDFIEVSLQAARVTRTAPDDSMVTHVRSMLAGRQPDLVVPIGGPAAVFAQRNRPLLFPSAPMLLAGVDRRFVRSDAITANDTALAVDHEPVRLVENILSVLPDTRTIFVMVAASHLDETWLQEMKSAFRPFERRVTFSWANELTFEQMLAHSARLPPHSAILFAMLSLDAAGVPHVEQRTLAELHAVANAPVFGSHSSQLGQGIVGGPLLSVEDLSHKTASIARRLLEGEPAHAISPSRQLLAAPVFDWRELRRWDIDEARLPSGSVIRFREQTAWQQYQSPIAVLVAAAGIQAMLVVALMVSQTRQRRTRRSLHESESEARFRQLSDAVPVMLWTSGPDDLCTHVNRARQDFTGRPLEAELGTGWSDVVHPDDVARCVEIYRRAFERREPFRTEYRLRRHDGEYRWILDTAVPRILADGAFAGYVGSGIDVTDLTLAKSALSSLSRRLMQAHEQERILVARELKEDLCQRMTVLTMGLHELSQAPVGGREDEIRSRAEDVRRQLAQLSGEMFAISDQLHSSNLDLLGLAAAVKIHCTQLSAQHGVTIDMQQEGVPPHLPGDVSLVLFRVTQEALDNVTKHAAARRVTVSLRGTAGEIQLEVADDGVGFDPTVTKDRALGLIGMRERLNLVGGGCAIYSQPGAGTRFQAQVPLGQNVH